MRVKEGFAVDIFALVDDLYKHISGHLDKPYAIYGHSMGGRLAFLLAHKIQTEKNKRPIHLFISGTGAPSMEPKEAPKHLLPGGQFLDAIKEMGGFPDEVLAHPELLDYFEPILRADFRVSETYIHNSAAPLNIPITVMYGDEEDMEEKDVLAWQNESIIPVNF